MTEEMSFGDRYRKFISDLGDQIEAHNQLASDQRDKDLRKYHDALNNLAVLVLVLKEAEEKATVVLTLVGIDRLDALSGLDFTNICSTLAIGLRKGWPVDPRLVTIITPELGDEERDLTKEEIGEATRLQEKADLDPYDGREPGS